MEGSANLAPKARDIPGGKRHKEGFKYYHFPKNSSILTILLVLFQSSRVEEVFSLMNFRVFLFACGVVPVANDPLSPQGSGPFSAAFKPLSLLIMVQ